eukprot:2488181-Lingulodinium_polyedra.AAC.1
MAGGGVEYGCLGIIPNSVAEVIDGHQTGTRDIDRKPQRNPTHAALVHGEDQGWSLQDLWAN